jgi:hypothetical protein
MRLRIVQDVRLPLGQVYAWCTDFQEGDPGLSGASIRARKVLVRAPDLIELEDHGVLGMPGAVHYTVRLRPPDGWDADGRSHMGTGHNEYRLASEGEGTRITVTFALAPRGGYRILAFFARPFLVRRLSRLWRDFARDMEEGR